jgi:hypothetical protein
MFCSRKLDHKKLASVALSVASDVITFANTRSSMNILYAALADSRDLNATAITKIQRSIAQDRGCAVTPGSINSKRHRQ